jgi:hypothetical protein
MLLLPLWPGHVIDMLMLLVNVYVAAVVKLT